MPLINRLVIGTAQLGMKYGINNYTGQPSTDEAFSILATAQANGINWLDTAEAYGKSQEVIGSYQKHKTQRFNVITKLSSIKNRNIKDVIINTLNTLQTDNLSACLFHSFTEYSNFIQWKELLELRSEGFIGKIGVSVYTNKEAEFLLDDDRVQLVQLPFNLLDNNHWRSAILKQLTSAGKEVHVRSVFLQGLFFMNINSLNDKLKPLKKPLQKIYEVAETAGMDIETLALAYVLNTVNIDKVLIGVETTAQLQKNLNTILNVNESSQQVFKSIDSIIVEDNRLLNPTTW